METRSRKRAATAPSSSSSSSSQSKRARLSAPPPSASTRSRHILRLSESSASALPPPPPPMDFTVTESSSASAGRRRGKNHQAALEQKKKEKEKEHEIRFRELGLNLDEDGEEEEDTEEDDDDEEGGMLHHNLSSASSALQGLLRKLGAGFDDLLPSSAMLSSSSQNGRLKKILTGLRADGEEGKQVESLTQLCELLSIASEDSLSTFSVDSFVPVLVGLLNHESNVDIMLLAARALTHLCDVLPSSCATVAHYGAVTCFVARLLTIEYMDLAEQSLQALKKISQEQPTACLRAGALMAVLSYLDFFSTGVQRVALSTAENICKKLPPDASDFVMEAVPLLTNLLQYHDSKVVEHASVCLTRIAEAFASSTEKLDELCNLGLVAQAASLISISNTGAGQASLSAPTYTGIIRLLSTCASGSPMGAKTLLHLGISGIIKEILSGSSLVASISVSPALTRPPQQIFEIVNLADELLPPLPQGTILLPTCSSFSVKGSIGKNPSCSGVGKHDGCNGNVHEPSDREKLLHDQPGLLQQFGMDILPVLIQIYGSSVNGPIRHKSLSVIGKVMYFSTPDMLQSLLCVTNISSFLAGVLAWKDPQVLVPAIQIAEVLMKKLPAVFSKLFVREGVVHAIDTLIMTDSSRVVKASSTENDQDSLSGRSSRSRRYRRRSGCPNTERSSLEEFKYPITGCSSSPSPKSAEMLGTNPSIRSEVSSCAEAFKDKFFPVNSGKAGVSDDLLHLKNLCDKLNACINYQKNKGKGKSKACGVRLTDSSATINEEHLIGVISEMLAELSKGDGVSTFEFIGSGVVAALLNYFSCGTFSKEKTSEASLPNLREQGLKRFKSFVAVALPTNVNEGSTAPMTLLVQKLQNALSSLERFPVVLSQPSRTTSGTARLSSGLSAISQPLKLRLCRAEGDKTLRDYSSNVVLIDPLATLAAVEEFLWPRVQRGDFRQKPLASAGNLEAGTTLTMPGASPPSASASVASARRHSSRTRSSMTTGGAARKDPSEEVIENLSKGKGKAVLRSDADGRGTQTIKVARRRAALYKDAKSKPAHGDAGSQDEELDILPEVDDELAFEDDDFSEDEDDDHEEVDIVPVSENVHDVKLGDSAEDGVTGLTESDSLTNPSGFSNKSKIVRGIESGELRNGSSYGSKGAMSFVAAAMAGVASASGRNIRGGRDGNSKSNDAPKLLFSVGGKQLNRNLTIYQAVQRQLVIGEDDNERHTSSDFLSSDGSRLWNDFYSITYRRVDTQAEKAVTGLLKAEKTNFILNASSGTGLHKKSLMDNILQGKLPCDLEKSNPTYNTLALLYVLEGINQLAPCLRAQTVSDDYSEGKVSSLEKLITAGAKVPTEEFINGKLTPKLARQIQDALALCSGSLPSWCYQLTKTCPFLFPFETRRQYFYSTALGLSRALHRLQQQQGAEGNGSINEREIRVGRLQRQKVRVSRNRILDSAAKVMEMYSSQKSVLEVEYFGEVGTGLGPTLEFYTLLSRDLQKDGLGMWRSSSEISEMEIDGNGKKNEKADDISDAKKLRPNSDVDGRDFVVAPLGLFPRPWPPSAVVSEGSQFSKVIEYFRLVGRVMAKALQDGRLLDLPLSTAFYKLVIGQELDLQDILSFDPEFGKILQELQVLVCRKQYLEAMGGNLLKEIADLRFRGAPIDDLCLDFTLPGYPDYILKPGEQNVDINNLEEYISLVVDATVKTGIARQLEAFRLGFNQVFDISSLQIFSSYEVDYLLCGRRELWKAEALVDHIKFDHGYNAKSPAIANLLEILAEFTPEQQRAFCQFVTGAPRLPPGGLAVLNPKLTIVRKHSSSTTNTASNGTGPSESADDDLPSVMTCANYLKLPPYSTKEIMYKKLIYAINEGQGSFDLS